MTAAPRSGAGVLASVPPNLPTAVRTAATITMSVLMKLSCMKVEELERSGLGLDVAARCGLDRLVLAAAGSLGSSNLLARVAPQPLGPIRPPAACVLRGPVEPGPRLPRQRRAVA